MIEVRVAKVVMTASIALFSLLVTFNNVVDYGSNFEFVRHVLSMDTTFPGNNLMSRSITTPALWHGAYLAIIMGEALTSLAFILGAGALIRNIRADADRFDRSKRFLFVGATLAFLLWFVGFMVVGGEWFLMWQSTVWNGQEAAFRFYITTLLVLLFVNQRERDLGRVASEDAPTAFK